ncbi:hypothetical protein RY831_10075 [Noviherbaspirillum sp. CPCC 100848]|uniref:Uncharacterized protein n=1 Tax=Noviherbaspirillum album TaxID=3080276 RepID=A0ABU6J789_9BURK|nr:hypothetical protein [Noviherbaspirillum sp. CPCC 100848]MEC4719499.1 hypothetical protein [Noviherbaspirillum sp. CPCC 100848]
MNNEKQSTVEVGKGDREVVRTKENPIGIDDIGLPAGIQPDEVTKLDDVRPDPAKTQQKQ